MPRQSNRTRPRRPRAKETKVTASLPVSIDLTKLKSGNSLDIHVRRGNELLGTLSMGRGSVEWWPRGNKTKRFRKSWTPFAQMLEEHMG
jgi:hypothetical protein